MRKLLQAMVCLMIIALSGYAYAEQEKTLLSPDGILKAKIISVSKKCSESRIKVYKASGTLSIAKDYASSDCQHGLIIEHAAWTPDSRFFVFSTYSSGGHQSWLSPTFFYSRQDNKIYNFADYLPPIAETKFILKAPDVVTIRIWTRLTTEKDLDHSIILPITFKLSDVREGQKRAKSFFQR